MASFSPIKLCDDDGGDAGVYRAEGEREKGTLPLLINESAARHSGRTLFPLNAIKARASGPDHGTVHGSDARR